MKPKVLFRVLYVLILAIPSFLLSQSNLETVNQQLDSIQYYRSAYPVSVELDRDMTVLDYCSSAYLFIHDELQEDLDSSLFIGRLIQFTSEPAEQLALLEDAISKNLLSKGSQKAKVVQLNTVAKEADFTGVDAESALEFMPEWQLWNYQYELQKLLAQKSDLSSDVLIHFDKFYRGHLQEIELELGRRGSWRVSVDNINNELLQRHFELRHRLNQLAIEEAYQFIDKSPEVIDTRTELAQLTAEITELEQQMGVNRNGNRNTDGLTRTRQLLTEQTTVNRSQILEYGLQDLNYKNNLTLHYDDVIQLHINKLAEQLAQEKIHLGFQKNHAVILQGLETRGPPGEVGPKAFTDIPYPKSPNGPSSISSLRLDEFITDDLVDKILKKEEKAFNREVSKQRAKFKALNLNQPQWQNVERSAVKTPFKANNSTPYNALRYNSTEYYRALSRDPAQASSYRAKCEAILGEYQKNNIGLLDLIADDLVLLAEIDESITKGIEARELRKATLGDHAEPWLDIEIENLKREQSNIRATRNQPGLNPEVKQLAARPPPLLDNERFQLDVLQRQKAGLQRVKATYGPHAPASVGLKMAQIDNLMSINKMGKALNNFQQFQQDAPLLKFWENALDVLRADGALTNLDYLLVELGNEGFLDAREQEVQIKTQLDETVEYLRYSKSRAHIPTELIDDATRARRTISTTYKSASSTTNERYRQSQDLEKVRGMARLKDPGGIWLSPQGIEIPIIFQTDLDWHYSTRSTGCQTENFTEWQADEATDVILCLRNDSILSSSNHWLNTLQSW